MKSILLFFSFALLISYIHANTVQVYDKDENHPTPQLQEARSDGMDRPAPHELKRRPTSENVTRPATKSESHPDVSDRKARKQQKK